MKKYLVSRPQNEVYLPSLARAVELQELRVLMDEVKVESRTPN